MELNPMTSEIPNSLFARIPNVTYPSNDLDFEPKARFLDDQNFRIKPNIFYPFSSIWKRQPTGNLGFDLSRQVDLLMPESAII